MLKTLLSIIGAYKVYEKWLQHQVVNEKKPDHIAFILDGNRRWASERRLTPWIGHQHGANKVGDLLDWCFDLGVRSITLYAFSTQNFKRSKREVEEIMGIIEEKLQEIFRDKRIHENRVRVKVIGRPKLLPEGIQKLVMEVEEATENYDTHFLNVALAYGGRAEIVDAAKKIAEKVKKGMLPSGGIDEQIFEKHLYTAHMSKQDPDLVIRTSGEERLSGFLLWQCAYSELSFQDAYWPEFRRIDLLRAIRTYQHRKRRFGR